MSAPFNCTSEDCVDSGEIILAKSHRKGFVTSTEAISSTDAILGVKEGDSYLDLYIGILFLVLAFLAVLLLYLYLEFKKKKAKRHSVPSVPMLPMMTEISAQVSFCHFESVTAFIVKTFHLNICELGLYSPIGPTSWAII